MTTGCLPLPKFKLCSRFWRLPPERSNSLEAALGGVDCAGLRRLVVLVNVLLLGVASKSYSGLYSIRSEVSPEVRKRKFAWRYETFHTPQMPLASSLRLDLRE